MASSFNSRLGTAPEEGCKAPVKTVANSPITLSGEQTIGTVAVVAGDRVLVNGQVDSAENGIYNVSTSTWSYAKDWNNSNDVLAGILVPSSETVELYQLQPFTGDYVAGTTEIGFQIGAIASPQEETQLGSQAVSRVFTFSSLTYNPNIQGGLEVLRNGQDLTKNVDYTETSSTSITLLFDPNDSDRFKFRANQAITLTTGTTASFTHTQSGTNYNLATYLQNRGSSGRAVDLVADFGADPTGATAINTIWATAMETFADGEGGRLIIPNGNFLVSETYRGVGDLDLQLDFPYDNVTVELQGNLVIQNTNKRHCCLLFGRRRGSTSTTPNRVSNIRLTGSGAIIGNTSGRNATSQWSSGVYVSNCTDSMIDGITIKDFYGENIYADALPYGPADGDNNNQSIPQRVSIVGVNMYGGYRNNVSVQNSESIRFISVTANDSVGSAPQAGFNIEPTYTDEPNGYYCRDISFIGCTANGNAGSGMEIVDTDAGTIDNIYVGGSTFRDNGTSSNGFGGIRVVSSDGEGSCRIIGNEVIDCYGLGIDHEGAGSGGANAGRRVIIANNFVSGTLEGTKSATQIGHGIGCRDGVIGTIVTGNIVEKCAHHGIWIDNTTGANQDVQVTGNSVYSNSQQTTNTYDNIHVSSGNTLIDVTNNHVRTQIPTVPVTNTAQYGVNVLSDFCRVEGNDVYQGGQTGNINYSLAMQSPDDGSRNGIVKSNAGYVNETMFRTSAFSVASTGAADIVIAHGLDTQGLGTASTAARVRSQISLTVIDEGTLTGDPVVTARVKDLDATNLTIRYNVTTAGSAGDQCRIAVKVNPPCR